MGVPKGHKLSGCKGKLNFLFKKRTVGLLHKSFFFNKKNCFCINTAGIRKLRFRFYSKRIYTTGVFHKTVLLNKNNFKNKNFFYNTLLKNKYYIKTIKPTNVSFFLDL